MNPSNKIFKFIENRETFAPAMYKDVAGNWTIGYGHKCSLIDLVKYRNKTITIADANLLMKNDLAPVVKELNKISGLNQNQFDALCSLVYNIGTGAFRGSTIRKYLITKKWDAAAGEFTRWVKSGGVIRIGLVVRRKQERYIFCQPVLPPLPKAT